MTDVQILMELYGWDEPTAKKRAALGDVSNMFAVKAYRLGYEQGYESGEYSGYGGT